MNASECPYHPLAKHRECHHIGTAFVTVWHDDELGWIVTSGHIDSRGATSARATPTEIAYQIADMRRAEGMS